jgi:hypothetical protein
MSKKLMMLDGIMTYGQDDRGREIADFQNVEPGVVVEPFVGKCKVQRVRDGHLYVTRLPKRIRNKPLFRQDHSSLSRGHNQKYYFVLTMDETDVMELPDVLIKESMEAAIKLRRHLAKGW